MDDINTVFAAMSTSVASPEEFSATIAFRNSNASSGLAGLIVFHAHDCIFPKEPRIQLPGDPVRL